MRESRKRIARWRHVAVARLACAVAVVLALTGNGATAEPENDECLACHGSDAGTADDGRSLGVAGDLYAASTHATIACVVCHTDAGDIPHPSPPARVGLDTCAVCHAEVVTAYEEGVHGPRSGSPPGARCGDCHGDVHRIRPHGDPASVTHWSHLIAACARCHADQAVAERSGIALARPVDAYLAGVHGRAVASGTRAAVCSDCHGTHAILPAADPRSTISRTQVTETCGACHAEVAAEYRESVHGVALGRRVRDAPTCVDCHGEHRILGHGDPTSPVFAANIPSATCGRCHGDLRLAARYGLPAENVASFRDSFHGLALRAGRVGVANCASCHGVHAILPSSDPRSLVHPANLASTCGTCHPGAGTYFNIGAVHVLPATSPERIEYWVRRVYIWLIVLVIGAMALHTGVDFVVKARRWPLPDPPPVVVGERMSRALRWQHGLVMISFPVLVYTGFALTYPESWWAAPLLRWESRFALRGMIHRIAAVVLLTALGWHAAQLVASRRVRAQLRGLWPAWRDLRDLAGRFAYYAGRRLRPPGGAPFSYVEKAEYWAFMWGMVIMTLSGVPLWFSDAALRYLPKWVTDVATAVHFYEAVLATLAIAVWHLYWTIFDPEVYPMDWTWWDGRPPLRRAAERQADEASAPPSPDAPPPPPGDRARR